METNQIESPLGSGCLHAGVKKCCWPSGSPSARRGGWAEGEGAGELPGRGSAASSLRAGKEMRLCTSGGASWRSLQPAACCLFFFFFFSLLFFLPCLLGMLIKGEGGERRRGTALILQSWQLSCAGLCPRRRAGVTPPGLRTLPGAQGRAGTAFAGAGSQAKGCGVFLGIVIASKILRARRGGESGRRVVCAWKRITVIISNKTAKGWITRK